MPIAFEDRVSRLAVAKRPARVEPRAHAQDWPQPTGGTRRQKLTNALYFLEQKAGLARRSSYTPLFRGLSKVGLIIKPLHFWSFAPLMLFHSFAMLVVVIFTVGLGVGVFAAPPRAVVAFLNAGLLGQLGVVFTLSGLATVLVRRQATKLHLPQWSDL